MNRPHREANEIERALAQKSAADNRPLGRDITTEDIEDAIAELALRKAARSAADKIKSQDAIIDELRVRIDESRSNTFTNEDREMLTEIYGKKKTAQLAQSLGGKRGAILAKATKTSDDPSRQTTETAAKWVLSKKESGDTRSQNAVIKDAANKFGFTECAIKQAVIRMKKRRSLHQIG